MVKTPAVVAADTRLPQRQRLARACRRSVEAARLAGVGGEAALNTYCLACDGHVA